MRNPVKIITNSLKIFQIGSLYRRKTWCTEYCRRNFSCLQHKNHLWLQLDNSHSNGFFTSCGLEKVKDRAKLKKKGPIDMDELSQSIDIDKMKSQCEKAIDLMKATLIKNVSIRSSIGGIEELTLKYEGKKYKLQDLVQISRKPKLVTLNVSSFPEAIPQVLECLQKSGMNLNPQQDGTMIYIAINKITKEHRENLAKNAKAIFIKCRDNIKDVRSHYINTFRKDIGGDINTFQRVEKYIEAFADQYLQHAEEILATKQKELLGESE